MARFMERRLDSPRDRVGRLLDAARRLANPSDPLGRQARLELPRQTALSPQGVERALSTALETDPSSDEVAALIGSVDRTERAHLLLSSNAFVGVHRALALAVAAAPIVYVRPSRREPLMAKLCLSAAPGLFELVTELTPRAGEQLFAYGSDATLEEVRTSLPAGVRFHGHGHGIGMVVVTKIDDLAELADGIAADTVLFDQRGCLSPRIVVVGAAQREAVVAALAVALQRHAEEVPLGELSASERADARRFLDESCFVGGAKSGASWGAVAWGDDLNRLPPVGRHLYVLAARDPLTAVAHWEPYLTCVAVVGPDPGVALMAPHARVCAVGRMQHPPFDGPVDRRPSAVLT